MTNLLNPIEALIRGQESSSSSFKMSDSLQGSPCDGYITHTCNTPTRQVSTTTHTHLNPADGAHRRWVECSHRTTVKGMVVGKKTGKE